MHKNKNCGCLEWQACSYSTPTRKYIKCKYLGCCNYQLPNEPPNQSPEEECTHKNIAEQDDLEMCCVAHSDKVGKVVPGCIRCPDCGEFVGHEEWKKLIDEKD